MKRIFKYGPAVGFILIILSSSCRMVYYPDDIDNPDRLLNVNGQILEDSLPVVKLAWTEGYYERNAAPVENAIVTITDDSGNAVTLTENNRPGLYTAEGSEYTGRVGSTYTLNIVTAEGDEFSSVPVTMPEKPEVDSFYVAPGAKKSYKYLNTGKVVEYYRYGMFPLTDISSNDDTEKYYRFRTRIVTEVVFSQYLSYEMPPEQGYYWMVNYADDAYNTAKTILLNDRRIVRRHESGFLERTEIINIPVEGAFNPIYIGWLVTHRVYAISADVHQFYESVRDHLTADNEIFAPVPSRVISNVYSVSNKNTGVIGVFEAASFRTFYKGCYYGDAYFSVSRDIPPVPDNIVNGYSIIFPPDFWQNIEYHVYY